MKPLVPVLEELLQQGVACAVVTVADARGSTPREAGARMLVTAERAFGTIGGGRLEYDAMQEARTLLAAGEVHALREVPLGPALGQCCGGHATVLIERATEADLAWLRPLEAGEGAVLVTRLDQPAQKLLLTTRDTEGQNFGQSGPAKALGNEIREAIAAARARCVRQAGGEWLLEPVRDEMPRVVLFGAGHVGRALAGALAPLPCRVRWVDQRPELFREPAPGGVEVVRTDHPLDQVRAAAPGVFALVMTHSHDLDCELCEAFLKRGDFTFLGLIGSASKRTRFEKRWRARGIADGEIRRLVCPIGLAEITGKQPEVIAASTAAQLLMAFEQRNDATTTVARQLLDA